MSSGSEKRHRLGRATRSASLLVAGTLMISTMGARQFAAESEDAFGDWSPRLTGFYLELDRPQYTVFEATVMPSPGLRQQVERLLGSGATFRPTDSGDNGFELVNIQSAEVAIGAGRAWDIAHQLEERADVAVAEPLFESSIPGAGGEELELCSPELEPTTSTVARPIPGAKNDAEWSLGPHGANVFKAWKRFQRALPDYGQGVVIGQIDTGYTRNPEIWSRSPVDSPVDPRLGWDVLSDSPDALDLLESGRFHSPGHGTRTASLIASPAGSESDAGLPRLTGAAPGARVAPFRVARGVSVFDTTSLARAIERAATDQRNRRRVDVISIGLGGLPSQRLRRAVDYAERQGVIVLAGAGDFGFVGWPARYPSVVSVAGSNILGRPWLRSSRGEAVDVGAPGESVWTANTRARPAGAAAYCASMVSGTSYAVATTAGVAALWLDARGREVDQFRHDGSLTTVFRALVKSTARQPIDWDTTRFGQGIVDADALLGQSLPTVLPEPVFQQVLDRACNGKLGDFTSLFAVPSAGAARLQALLGGSSVGLCEAAQVATELATLYATRSVVRKALDDLLQPSPPVGNEYRRARRRLLKEGDISATLRRLLEVAEAGRVQFLVWESRGNTRAELSNDLSQLFQTLQRRDRLPVREVLDSEGLQVQELLRREGLWFGSAFPVEIDRLLCELNPRVCRCSPRKSLCDWSNAKDAVIRLPALQLEVASQPVVAKRVGGAERLENAWWCGTTDVDCRDRLQSLNQHVIAAQRSLLGNYLEPALVIRATLTVPADDEATAHDLEAYLLNGAPGKLYGAFTQEPQHKGQQSLFAAISHPILGDAWAPPTNVTRVAVIDGATEFESHCEAFDEADPQMPPACAELDDAPKLVAHGTHVAGVIGARLNRRGVAGINPAALIKSVAVSGGPTASKVRDALLPLMNHPTPSVVNLSLGYTKGGSNDVALDLIRNAVSSERFLLVGAAGEGGNGINDPIDCTIRPACYSLDLPNVISVVAIDDLDSPQVMNIGGLTSDSGVLLDVAAPGVGIWGPVTNQRFGQMSGTSQATAVVSGVASLVNSVATKLSPGLVKMRLIAAGDLLPSLEGKVLGGRVNVERSLDVYRDRIILKSEPGKVRRGLAAMTPTSRQRYMALRRQPDGTVVEVGKETNFLISRLRRLARASCPGRECFHVLIDEERESKRPTRLLVSFNYADNKGILFSEETAPGQLTPDRIIRMSEIEDWTRSSATEDQ